MGQEIELKFATTGEIPERAWAQLAAPPAETAQLNTVYFDTSDLALTRNGLALRVRRKGDAYSQSVKAGNEGALASVRVECEARLASPEPQIALIADKALRETIRELIGDSPLEPQFETDVARTTRHLHTDAGDEIEVAADSGAIRACGNGRDEVAISEIELELKQGRPAALYEVARALAQSGALALTVETKAERGLRLIEGAAPEARKAGHVRYDSDATAEEAFAAVMQHCLRHLANNIAAVQAFDSEGVHQMRVALRRFRAALTCFGASFRTPRAIALNTQAKAIADALGPARDLDVFALELLPAAESADDPPDLKPLKEALGALTARARQSARDLVCGRDFALLLIDAAEFTEQRGWREHAPSEHQEQFDSAAKRFARDMLSRRLKKVEKRARHLKQLTIEERHALRIAMKKLRYACEFFAPCFSRREVTDYLALLSETQDLFGAMNDGATARHVLARIETEAGSDSAEAAAFVAGWHMGRIEPTWNKARKAYKRFERAEPFWL